MIDPQKVIHHFAFLPFLMTGAFCFLESFLTKDRFLIQEPSQLLSDAFKNYFSFIGIMIVIKLVITLSITKKSTQLSPKDPFFSFHDPSGAETTISCAKMKQAIINICKFMICYTLLFGCFQLVFTIGFWHLSRNSSSPQGISSSSSYINFSSRHLDQMAAIELSSGIPDSLIEPEKLISSPDLNPGEILGSFNPGPVVSEGLGILISKDAKTLYTITNYTLAIFDISNPKKPSKLGSLKGIGRFNSHLLLSLDEKCLFVLGYDIFYAIDVTNKASPSEVYKEMLDYQHWDKNYSDDREYYFSMLLSSDGETLWTINNDYLKSWDVSDPKTPVFISYRTHKSYRGTIALSKNNTILAVALENAIQIYNVERPRWPKEIGVVKNIDQAYSLAFSQDGTKLMLGVQADLFDRIKVYDFKLLVFDITNPTSPAMLTSWQLNKEASYGKLWFHANGNYAFFNAKREFRMINILDGEQTTLFSSLSDVRGLLFTPSSGNKINAVYFSGMIHMLRLNIDMIPKSFLHFSQNALRVIDDVDFERRRVMEISKDGKHLFLARMNTTAYPGYAEVIPYERKSCASFEKLNPSAGLVARVFEELDDDGQWVFAAGKNVSVINYIPKYGSNLFLLNMTNKNQSYGVTNIKFFNYFQRIPAFALTNDDKSLAFVTHTENREKGIKTLRLSIISWNLTEKNLSYPLTNLDMPFSLCFPFSLMKTNQNDSLLFYANCDLLIYNITKPSATTLESSLSLNISRTYSFILSKDEKILFLLGSDSASSRPKLLTFNISDQKSPQLLSSIFADQASFSLFSESTESLELSSDETTLYVGFLGGILLVDVRILTRPFLFGFNYFLDQMYTPRFTDNATLLYTSSFKGVTAYDFSSQHVLYFEKSELKIGGSYSILLNALKLNKNIKFDFMTKRHRFLKVTLLEQSSTSYTALPNWMTFDKEKSLLKIEPDSPSHNGTYKIAATVTTQTQPSAFVGLDSIGGISEAKELMLNLIQSGYMDNQGYISGDLNLNQELWINSRYQSIEKDVRAILSKSYIQAIGEISVISSLKLSEAKPLRITTLSKDTIYMTIQLDQDKGVIPRFSTKSHSSLKPVIDNKKSILRLEGLLENVNEALREVVVDLNGLQACDGEINITDGINPSIISRRISSLSNYLYINDQPQNNLKNLQDQIDSRPFYTGLYSAIDINSSTFTDKNNLTLEYSLELEDSKLGLPPAWITLKGLSLMATPPESYTKFSYNFVLRVSNEFQNITVPFTLKVKISFNYAVKLAVTFLGYAVSLIGFIYSVNKVYNVVARKYYRHPRSFKLKVGEEINDTNLFPVSFIWNEVIKSKDLFKALERYVTQNHHCSLLEHFVDSHSQILNQQKIIDTLEIIDNGSDDIDETDTFSHGTTKQLIINRLIMKQLSTKQENKTRHIFNKIKNKWMDLVISTPSPAQFVINSQNLDKGLSNLSLSLADGESLNETHFEPSDSLLNKDSFNLDLLANAIIAHAFSYQNIDINLILIDVISYKRIKGRTLYHWIKKLLLKNLKPFVFLNKREIGCGIEYQTDENTLHFSGKLTHELKNDTIVIHLKNYRGRILREFWIVGDNQAVQAQQGYIENVSETL